MLPKNPSTKITKELNPFESTHRGGNSLTSTTQRSHPVAAQGIKTIHFLLCLFVYRINFVFEMFYKFMYYMFICSFF
ncbi:Regulator of chromosome condensation (RCC1) family protein [Zea mays]|uniref:Regulator of chromosome condensation (RCC1) family protein n=1 Tax=Zea mays TaxID=4577 RepID=A0A1D6NA31_MAIZE|nr:Regulator of chromosome condensation (RCC1) family protein [Zea mays]